MKILRIFLVVATVAIYALTLIATVKGGLNWPAVAISDLLVEGLRIRLPEYCTGRNVQFSVYRLRHIQSTR